MKLTLAQALATVLNIHLVPPTIVGASNEYVIRDHSGNGEDIPLGTNLRTAIIRAIETYPLDEEIAFAIFPIGSEREGFYMEIERELLRQETMPHMEGHKAWESFGTDPRNAVTALMDTAREAARNLTVPPIYRTTILRFCCVAVAALQWCDKWIEKLTTIAKDPDLGNRIIRPAGSQTFVESNMQDCPSCGRRLEDCECEKISPISSFNGSNDDKIAKEIEHATDTEGNS